MKIQFEINKFTPSSIFEQENVHSKSGSHLFNTMQKLKFFIKHHYFILI